MNISYLGKKETVAQAYPNLDGTFEVKSEDQNLHSFISDLLIKIISEHPVLDNTRPSDWEYLPPLSEYINESKIIYQGNTISAQAPMLWAPVLAEVIKNKLLAPGGYLPALLGRLYQMVQAIEKLDGKLDHLKPDYYLPAKALYFAEMFNNELDTYLNIDLSRINVPEWLHSAEFKQSWNNLKRQRDKIYDRLYIAVKKFPQEEIEKNMHHYGDYLLRFHHPTPPTPTPPTD